MFKPLALFSLLPLLSAPAQASELVMFESYNCPFCEKWDSDLAGVYPKTPEGKRAPLRRIHLSDPRPDDLKGIKPIRYTPTFVLIEDGEELGRITGYNSEDFFWGLLGELLDETGANTPSN